ncbi:MAG: aminotransferase class I/II-fold pyridoxal phosphate-dependent enzyme [Thermoanaerobaculum sp.]|nr:aminotransferase class I/II-fold pyridoxal phosphate-dependent enzyme [Thermoanaerobaculum sp.]MDW7968243.1 aminotransferase class I/II-fold pyridoxal phosphate-dependent enzyme [Thermoanaerobaculum sp.]
MRPAVLSSEAIRLRLDLNEAPSDADATFRQRFLGFLQELEWRRYPPEDGSPAREAAASLYGWRPEGTLVGNGSAELLAVTLSTLCQPGAVVLTLWPSFSLYPVLLRRVQATELRYPLAPPIFAVEDERLLSLAARADVLLLCSPNNPTGGELSARLWRELLRLGKPTIWDGAYWEFGTAGEMADWLAEFPHLVVTRSLSKAWGLAGVRAGGLCTSPALAERIHAHQLPFFPGVAVWAAFHAAAADPQLGKARAMAVTAERERQLTQLGRLPGVEVVPSAGNFYLLRRVGWQGQRLAQVLAQAGVAVRVVPELDAYGYVRVTVGTPAEGDVLMTVLQEVVHGLTTGAC